MSHFRSIVFAIVIGIVMVSCNSSPSGPNNSSGNNALFVLNANAQNVSRVNLDSATVTNDFATAGDVPADIAVYGSDLLILNSTPPSLEVTDLADGTVKKTVNLPLQSNPYQILVDQDAIYITGWLSNQLYLVNGLDYSLVDSVEVGVNPQGLIANQDYIFVANSGGYPNYSASTVSVVNKSDFTLQKNIQVDLNPQNFAWGPLGNLHVVCTGDYSSVGGRVDIIDPGALNVQGVLQFGGTPGFISITDQGFGYLTDYGTSNYGFLYKYDALQNTVIRDQSNPIQINPGAMDLLFDQAASRLYVANFGVATVQEFSTKDETLVNTYTVSDGPQSLALYREQP